MHKSIPFSLFELRYETKQDSALFHSPTQYLFYLNSFLPFFLCRLKYELFRYGSSTAFYFSCGSCHLILLTMRYVY